MSLRTRVGELERERAGNEERRGAAEMADADPVRRRVGAQP